MRPLLTILFSVVALFGPGLSWAVLDLELTSGSKTTVPLAINPLSGTASVTVKRELMNRVEKDLQRSGWFRLLKPDASLEQTFRERGANALLGGRMTKVASGQFQLELKLNELYGASAGSNSLMHVSYQVKKSGLRALAHRISDQIFEKLTGVRGNFSTKLAYVTVTYAAGKYVTYHLMVSDADGDSPHVLLRSYSPIMSPAWSPDGKYLAYVAFDHHRAQIYLQDLSTGKRKRILGAPGINGAPSFSPDGSHLAVVLSKSGSPKIYDLNLLTGKVAQLTKGWSIDTEPAWSPDGQSLLFTSNRDGSPQIYQYTFSNHAVKRLTFSGNYNARARWLPSGEGFVVMHRDRFGRGFRIALQRLNQSGLQSLTKPGELESPSIAPNGQMIVYTKGQSLAQVSSDGDVTRRLPSASGQVQEPAWSPFMSPKRS